MPKKKYINKGFRKKSLALIGEIDSIISDFQQMGYSPTVRQCYYQLVSKALIENTQKSYKRIDKLIADGRMAGLLDWRGIEDRTRRVRGWGSYESPADFLQRNARNFVLDLWQGQPCYLEIWVEKDALVEIVHRACISTRTPFFSCRGYSSHSAMWEAANRFNRRADREGIILHLGDHDPSGLDMTREIQERLNTFNARVKVKRIALSMEQIQEYNPPPNFAKEKDARYKGYRAKYGCHCWELDAMRPEVMKDLIQQEIRKYMDMPLFESILEQEKEQEKELHRIAANYQGALAGAAG